MLIILARLGRSESFWAVIKVRSPHTGPEVSAPFPAIDTSWDTNQPGVVEVAWRFPLHVLAPRYPVALVRCSGGPRLRLRKHE